MFGEKVTRFNLIYCIIITLLFCLLAEMIQGETMKVIVEIENDEDMKRVERFLKFLQPAIIKTTIEKANKIKGFLEFIDTESIPVEKIVIPCREERNAR